MDGKDIPVIFISARADVISRVQGLRLGAEDELVKPFDMLATQSKTILLASHFVQDIDELCDDVSEMTEGHLL